MVGIDEIINNKYIHTHTHMTFIGFGVNKRIMLLNEYLVYELKSYYNLHSLFFHVLCRQEL